MRKTLFAGCLLLTLVILSCENSIQPLSVSEDGRYIETADGQPFLWFGDTDWVMFHRTTVEDAERYFSDRAEKGFNVIQAGLCGAGVIEGVTDPSSNMVNGLLPFHFKDSLPDPTKPNEKFFHYADSLIDLAAEYGLYIGLLPTWAEFVCPAWHNGPKIFNIENAKAYGEFLGKRYAGKTNIIWVIGGDRNPYTCDSNDIYIWHAMAEGIKAHDPDHLMTFHPQGNTCSDEWFHEAPWLDFNMYQSIRWPQNIMDITGTAYNKLPAKPVVNGEPFYYGNRQIQKDFDDRIFRSQPYWSFIAGARGYTFGQHHVWFFDKDDPYKNFENNTGIFWHEKLDTEGTRWAVRAMEIIRSLEWWNLVPDPAIILDGRGSGTEEIVVCRMPDHSVYMIYFPVNSEALLDLASAGNHSLKLTWYKTDDYKETSMILEQGRHAVRPPDGWEDGLLLIK